MNRINEWLAVRGTGLFGTMWACYVLLTYGLLPTIFPGDQIELLYWSNVVQLVALPLIMVGQKIQGREAEIRDNETHDMVREELGLVREEIALVRDESAEIKEILADVAPKGTLSE